MAKIAKLLILCVVSCQSLIAQNVKNEAIEYKYIKLPLTPLPKTIQNYQSSVLAPYEVENKKKKDQYEAEKKAAQDEYEKEKADYPEKVRIAQDKYDAEMKEWNSKSMAEKVVEKKVLHENNKPVLHLPYQPYLKTVSPPYLRTSYDYPVLASTYLALDGYTNNPENALKIEVTLHGFDFTQPRQLTETKSELVYANGTSSTKNTNYYHTEFTYRHTMSVKVTGPDGKDLFNLSPPELNNYKIYKSDNALASQSFNQELLIKTYEEKILQDNLVFINNLVNDKIGFRRETRKTILSYVKSKGDTYTDLLVAYNDALAGLKLVIDDPEASKVKLENSIKTWQYALNESNINDRKARIDKGVTIMIYFNLLECYFAMGDTINYEKIISILNAIPISSDERKQKEEYEALFNDLKKRQIANK